jgi:hypothetical protein
MEPTGNNHSFGLPPALLAEVEAADEHRPVAEVVRDFVERGLSEWRWKAHSEQASRRARELGLPDAGDQPMSEEYYQTLREKIAQGMASARQGKLVDGDAVFARLKAENSV